MAAAHDGGIALPPVHEPGYHLLEHGACTTTIAVAPTRAYTLEDAAQGAKLWGLTVQLYALGRKHDGGIGDFAALADFAARAAQHGADAIGISPVHALFSADVTRFGPYAPSSRAALNVLHIAQDTPAPDDEALINWPLAAATKLKLLREIFERSHSPETAQKIRAEIGPDLHRHAIFEALAAPDTGQAFSAGLAQLARRVSGSQQPRRRAFHAGAREGGRIPRLAAMARGPRHRHRAKSRPRGRGDNRPHRRSRGRHRPCRQP